MGVFGMLFSGAAAYGATKLGGQVLRNIVSANKIGLAQKFAKPIDDVIKSTLNNKPLFLKSFVPGGGLIAGWKQLGGMVTAGKQSLRSGGLRDKVYEKIEKNVLKGAPKGRLAEYTDSLSKFKYGDHGKEGVSRFKAIAKRTNRKNGISMDSSIDRFINLSEHAEGSSRLFGSALISNTAVIGMPTLAGSVAAYKIGSAAQRRAKDKINGF